MKAPGPALLLTLTLFFVTLTLASACHMRGFVCRERQPSCRGRCVMRSGGGCVCSPYSYGYDPYYTAMAHYNRGRGGRGGRPEMTRYGGRYMELEKLRKMRMRSHPLSERNFEQSHDMIHHFIKLDRILN